jgi:hypothetical protein
MFEMRAVKAFTAIILGAFWGYMVWHAYFATELPEWLIRTIINAKTAGMVESVLGSKSATESFLIFALMFVRSLPAGIVLGTLGGIVFLKLRYRRLFIYSTLIWPLGLLVSSHMAIQLMEDQVSRQWASVLWQRRAEHAEAQFVLYSVLLAAIFIASRVLANAFKRNSLQDAVSSDGLA